MNDEAKQLEDIDAESSRQLLIAQLNEMSEDWRHLDKRIESALALYVSVFTLIVGAAAIYSDGEDLSTIHRFTALAALVLAAFGFFTAKRIKNAAVSRSRRQLSMNLIKLFFQERHPKKGPYLPVYVSTPRPLEGTNDCEKIRSEMDQLKPKAPYLVIHSMYILNSVLVYAGITELTSGTFRSINVLALDFTIAAIVLQFVLKVPERLVD